MSTPTSHQSTPFEALVEQVASLSPQEKVRLFELLHEQLEQLEETMYENNPTIKVQIAEARAAYASGEYVTLRDYLAGKRS
jgi:hypothetical protein